MRTPKDISLTARYTAAVWDQIGLPYASRFADVRGRAMVAASVAAGRVLPRNIGTFLIDGALVPRHLFMDDFVKHGGFEQVVEVAAGYSPRGMLFANLGLRYIEVDRPNVMREKEQLCSGGDAKKPVFLGIDATAPDFVERVVSASTPNLKTLIITEGLSPYFARRDYVAVLRNLRALAARLNAVFLTDFYRDVRNPVLRGWMEFGSLAIKLIADRTYMYAKNEEEIRAVFEEAGFTVRAVHRPAADPRYTQGKKPAVTDWMVVVEAEG